MTGDIPTSEHSSSEHSSSEHYTHGHHETVLRSHLWRTAWNSAAYLLPHLTPGMSILDVGCGPGNITIDLAALIAPGRVVGIDASPEVIAQATELAQQRGVTNVEFRVGDAYALELDDASFDVVHAHQVLQHLSRPVDALREWKRVVRPGGIVAARDADYAGTVLYPESEGLVRWGAFMQESMRSDGHEANAGRRLKAWAHAAGLDEVSATASVWCFSSDDERAWWGTMWADRVVSSAIADDALGKGLATREVLERMRAAWAQWAADRDGWMSMPHGEIVARA